MKLKNYSQPICNIITILIIVILPLLLMSCAPPRTSTPTTPLNDIPQQPIQEELIYPIETASAKNPTVSITATASQSEHVLRVAMQPVVQIDPALISSDSEVLLANLVYDYLIDMDAQGKLAPRLAASWQVSQDGMRVAFQLAAGVTFHDGSPFSAQDVVWSFDHLRDPTLDLPTSSLYNNIEKVEASSNGKEVTFTLKQPNPFFLYDLSANQALILKKGTTDADKRFNGTGAYKVKEYLPEDRVRLEANEQYFMRGLPKTARIELIFFADETAMANALRSEQIDVILRLGTDVFLSLENQPGIQTISIPANGFDLVRLRSDRVPGNNPKVVQAIKLATDRQAIFQVVQQKYGAVGRDSPIGPMYVDYYSEEISMPTRDVEKARALLKEAGYPNGLELDMHVPDSGNRPNLAVVLKEQWAEAGININVIIEPESIYYGENKWLDVDLGITGWSSRPYPQFYLDVMLKCDASWNEAHFCDKEFDEVATLAGTTLNEEERVKAYHEIQRMAIERVPVIIPYFMANFAAIREGVTGFELKGFSGRSDFRVVEIQP